MGAPVKSDGSHITIPHKRVRDSSLRESLTLQCERASRTAQDVKREGKVYVEQKKSSEAKPEEKTGFTYKDAKGVSFDIYIGKTGSCYINKVSKNGNKYRKYLGEEISREICQSLGRKYQPKSK